MNCAMLNNPCVTSQIESIICKTYNACENIYFDTFMKPGLQTIWKQEKKIMEYIIVLIYINLAIGVQRLHDTFRFRIV